MRKLIALIILCIFLTAVAVLMTLNSPDMFAVILIFIAGVMCLITTVYAAVGDE
jgi:hypothetical protein